MNWYRKYNTILAQDQRTFDFFKEKSQQEKPEVPEVPEKKLEPYIELVSSDSYGYAHFNIDNSRYTYWSPHCEFIETIRSKAKRSHKKALDYAKKNYKKGYVVEADETYRDLPDR